MPAATKKSPAKKAASSKKATPAPASTNGDTPKIDWTTIDPAPVVAMRDDEELSYKEIGDAIGVGRSLAEVVYMKGKLTTKDFVKWSDEDDLAVKTVQLRDGAMLSWGQIAARTGVSESKLRGLYTGSSGKDHVGNRIGKGGRFPAGQGPTTTTAPVKKASKAAKAAKTPAAGGKASATKQAELNPERKHIGDMNLGELQTRINGQTMKVGRTGKPRTFKVGKVQKLAKGEMHFSDDKGASHVVKLAEITKVG